MLSIAKNKNKQIETFANELTQILSLAEEQAMLQPSILGLQLSESSFQFASLQPASEKETKEGWKPVQDNLLGHHKIPENIFMKIDVGAAVHKDKTNQPGIIISTNGDLTPFTIYIGQKGKKPRYAIRGEANGHVSSQLLS